jgi:NADPH:quinone reductase-like Zn-dependent oxidoreductase
MRAIVEDRYGPAPEDVLRPAKIERPAIADGEVLTRVHAAGLDRGTWHVKPCPQYRNACGDIVVTLVPRGAIR